MQLLELVAMADKRYLAKAGEAALVLHNLIKNFEGTPTSDGIACGTRACYRMCHDWLLLWCS